MAVSTYKNIEQILWNASRVKNTKHYTAFLFSEYTVFHKYSVHPPITPPQQTSIIHACQSIFYGCVCILSFLLQFLTITVPTINALVTAAVFPIGSSTIALNKGTQHSGKNASMAAQQQQTSLRRSSAHTQPPSLIALPKATQQGSSRSGIWYQEFLASRPSPGWIPSLRLCLSHSYHNYSVLQWSAPAVWFFIGCFIMEVCMHCFSLRCSKHVHYKSHFPCIYNLARKFTSCWKGKFTTWDSCFLEVLLVIIIDLYSRVSASGIRELGTDEKSKISYFIASREPQVIGCEEAEGISNLWL